LVEADHYRISADIHDQRQRQTTSAKANNVMSASFKITHISATRFPAYETRADIPLSRQQPDNIQPLDALIYLAASVAISGASDGKNS
jgi:hypothetical protein